MTLFLVSLLSIHFVSVSAESVPDATESYGLSAVVGSITSNIKLRSDPEEYQDGYGAYLLVTVGRGSVDGRRKRRSSDEKTFTGKKN